MTAAAKLLFCAALLSVSLPVAAEDQHNKLHPLVLYDRGGSALVTCQMDEAGNVSGCSMNGTAKVDDLVQRMVEQMKAAQYAKFTRVGEQLTQPHSFEYRDYFTRGAGCDSGPTAPESAVPAATSIH